MGRCIISKLTIFLLLNLSVWLMVMPSHASATKKQVLILNSYDQGRSWTENVMHGMLSVLNNSRMDMEIHVEYMDTKRHPPKESFPYLENMYRRKYERTHFDVILLSDNNALTFLLSRRDTLFPGVPIVFCGINNFSKELLCGQTGLTGITEDIDIKGTIDLASRIVPSIQKVIVINDRTPTGQANRAKFEQVAPDLPVSFELWDDLTATDIQERLKGLPPDSAVLVFTFHRDKDGQWFSIPEYWTLIRESCRVPIFSLWDNDLGHGVLGGVMVYGREQGRLCAEYAIRILKGEPADSLPVLLESPNVPVLDYRLLKKFNIPKANIPAEAVVLFEPESLFHKYRNEIIASAVLFALLIVLVIGLSVNILIRRRTERALIKSEALLEATQELAKVGGWEWDVEKDTMFWTEEMYRIHGFDPEDIPPGSTEHIKRSLECYDPEDRPVIMAAFERCAKEGQGYDLEFPFTRQNGQRLWIRTTARSVISDGTITKVIGTIMDITKQKQAVEALRESEAQKKAVLDSSLDRIRLVDTDLRIIWANRTTARELNISPEELVGKICYEVFVERDRPCPGCPMLKSLKSGKIEHAVMHQPKSKGISGDTYWDTYAVPIKDESGNIVNLIETSRNITERKKAGEEKERLEAQLNQAQKMEAIGTLAGGIAHDFNNILAIILGNAELASADVPDSNPASLSLKEIHRASIRAKDMVQQLLAFSRKTDEKTKPIDLAPIIKESMKMLRSAIPTSVEFKQHLSDDPCSIMGDATQINQIVMNLVTNAADAMSKEGGLLEVTLEKIILQDEKTCFDWVLSPGPYVKLRMKDTGEGIAPKIMERIFDPYFTTKEVGKGTGMGLSVIHGIVKRHGGGIRVESELGKGTLFEIYFPALEERAEEEKELNGEIKGGSERVLFVDDEASLVDLNRQRLGRLGYQVKSTTKPEEALEWFRADPDQFDVIITDMTMPRMSGDRLATEVLKIRPHMPVIICTGYSERMSAKKAEALGVRKYIEKPIDLRNLASSLRQLLDEK